MDPLDDTGHNYALVNFENKGAGQQLQFIKKQTLEDGRLVTVHDGTTTEEVLKALIHRTRTLSEKFPSRESSIAITKMEEALMWFDARQRDRQTRGVQGQHKL